MPSSSRCVSPPTKKSKDFNRFMSPGTAFDERSTYTTLEAHENGHCLLSFALPDSIIYTNIGINARIIDDLRVADHEIFRGYDKSENTQADGLAGKFQIQAPRLV